MALGRSAPADVTSLRMLRKARDRIDRDYREEIGIAALASDAGYSREHFIRAFHAAYGETPGRYRTRRRVERARDLLRSANLTVTEICYLVGFSSVGTFSSRFSELTGMSPKRYRAEAAARGGPAPIPGCFALMWETGLPAARATPATRAGQDRTCGEARAAGAGVPSGA
jgi:AraC-like DNA-binding protein